MRWKLLIIASLVAALISTGGSLALVYWLDGRMNHVSAPAIAGLIIIPLIATTLASIFVYRHTARRRKLQAISTALLSIILTLAALFATTYFSLIPPTAN